MKTLDICCLFSIVAGMATSCSTETYEFPSDEEKEELIPVRFSSRIETIETRVVENSWEEGDETGIFMYRSGEELSDASVVNHSSNRKYVSDADGSFSPATEMDRLYYPSTGSVGFVAYYPFGGVEDYTVRLDVGNQRVQSELDFLYSNNLTEVKPTTEALRLTFSHQLSKLEFTLTAGAGLEVQDLEGATLTLMNVVHTASFSLVNGTLVTGTETDDVRALLTSSDTGAEAEAILIPQECAEVQVSVALTSGQRYLYNFADEHEWKVGNKYRYAMTLTKDSQTESVLEAEITEWTDNDSSDALQEFEIKPWDGVSANTTWYSDDASVMTIGYPEELAGLAQLVNNGYSFEGKTVRLANDLDMNNKEWIAIGNSLNVTFNGTFEGDNHLIANLNPVLDTTACVGLFGVVEGAVNNLAVSGTFTVSSENQPLIMLGAICASNKGIISGCRSYASINGSIAVVTDAEKQTNPYVGGIVGQNLGTLSNCQNYGSVRAENVNTGELAYVHLGGIAGSNNKGTISNCENTRKLTAINGQVRAGGITGLSTGANAVVENCRNLADVVAESAHVEASVGGIVGKLSSESSVKEVENRGAVTVLLADDGKVYGGGLVALVDKSASVLSGSNYGGVSVTGTSGQTTLAAAGGIAGYCTTSGEVHLGYNYGTASASGAKSSYQGGITGFADPTSGAEGIIYGCCLNGGTPSRWIGNATDSDNMVSEEEHTEE